MINGQTVLALITARGGSKGVPGKNIRLVGGSPLIGWTISAALCSRYIDRVILSSDDLQITNVAAEFGCEIPFLRDPKLAQDDTASIDVVLDALERCKGFDWIILLQPTSPLRTTQDIDSAIELCLNSEAQSCVSVCKSTENPYWMFTLSKNNYLKALHPEVQFSRRQDLPTVHVLNGAIYLARTDWLKRTKSFISKNTIAYDMPLERSLDIDTEFDLKLVDFFMAK